MHRRNRYPRAVLVVLGALGLALAVSAAPAEAALGPEVEPFQYMVKFVCGFVPDVPQEVHTGVKPGNYATAINIHNYTSGGMISRRRVALHFRPGTAPPYPPAVPPKATWITPRRVLEVDCIDIWAVVGVPPETYLKGMVHIGLPQKLPVAAVYTAQTDLDPLTPADPGAGMTIDVENVPPFISPPDMPGIP